MKGKRFTDEQIAYALRQAEGGTRTPEHRRIDRAPAPPARHPAVMVRFASQQSTPELADMPAVALVRDVYR